MRGRRRDGVKRIARWLVAASCVALCAFIGAGAAQNRRRPEERVRYLRELVVQPGETTGEVTCIACSIRVYGTVMGDATTVGGEVKVDGTVTGDATAVGGAVRLGPLARVEGDADSLGGPVVRDAHAVVGGDVEAHPWMYWPGQRQPYWKGMLGLLGMEVALLLVFYLAARPVRVLRMAATLEHRPWWSVLAGALTFALICFLYYELAVMSFEKWLLTGRGDWLYWGLAAVLLILYGFGHVGIACRLGRTLRLRSGAVAGLVGDAPLPLTAVGILLIFVLELVPVIGTLAFVLLALLSLGAAVLSVLGSFPRVVAAPAQGGGPAAPR
jgi:hypothetical protein